MSVKSSNNIFTNNQYSYNLTDNTIINSSNDVFDTSKVSVDATSSLTKWVDVGVRNVYPVSSISVVFFNASRTFFSSSTNNYGIVPTTVKVMQYYNFGGIVSHLNFTANYTYNGNFGQMNFTSPINNYAIPYYFVIDASGTPLGHSHQFLAIILVVVLCVGALVFYMKIITLQTDITSFLITSIIYFVILSIMIALIMTNSFYW
jgi:hypothetical protein